MSHPFKIRMTPGAKIARNSSGQITLNNLPGGESSTEGDFSEIVAEPAEYVAFLGDKEALGLRPMVLPYKLPYFQCHFDTRLILSRFALMRRLNSTLVWETPLAPARLWCYSGALAGLWALLAQGTTAREAAKRMDLDIQDLVKCLELCISAKIVVVEEEKRNADHETALEFWTIHEAFFHTRSRIGRHNNLAGNMHRFRELCPPPSGYRQPFKGYKISLPKPDISGITTQDISLFSALENRRSKRKYDHSKLVSLDQLGHFLYYAARITDFSPSGGPYVYDVVKHVYPTGGGMGELEIYILASKCESLSPGAYHYDALAHSLTLLDSAPSHCMASLLDWSGEAIGEREIPHVMLLISARMNRVMWKYSSISYSLVLKDVGALMQTFYLVATALGIDACAIGAGNSEIFAELTGNSYWEESLVGEFVLGIPAEAP